MHRSESWEYFSILIKTAAGRRSRCRNGGRYFLIIFQLNRINTFFVIYIFKFNHRKTKKLPLKNVFVIFLTTLQT